MKLDRLASTTQRPSGESSERARSVAPEQIRRVEAQEGIEGDRERSIQQEIATIDPKAIGSFAGEEQVRAGVHRLAARLVVGGGDVANLLKLSVLSARVGKVDESA